MLEKAPSNDEMIALIGKDLFAVWAKLCALIETKYDMERVWNSGGNSGGVLRQGRQFSNPRQALKLRGNPGKYRLPIG